MAIQASYDPQRPTGVGGRQAADARRRWLLHQRMLGKGSAMTDEDRQALLQDTADAHRRAGNPVLTIHQPHPGANMRPGHPGMATLQPTPQMGQPIAQAPPQNGGMISAAQMNQQNWMGGGATMAAPGAAGGAMIGHPGMAGPQPVAPPIAQAPAAHPPMAQPPAMQPPVAAPGMAGAAMIGHPGMAAPTPAPQPVQQVGGGAVNPNPTQGVSAIQDPDSPAPTTPQGSSLPPTNAGGAHPPVSPNPGAVQSPPGGPGNATPGGPNPGATQTPPGGGGGAGTQPVQPPAVPAQPTIPPQNPGESGSDYFARVQQMMSQWQAGHPAGPAPAPITGPSPDYTAQQNAFYEKANQSAEQAAAQMRDAAMQQSNNYMAQAQQRLSSMLAARGFGAAAANTGMAQISRDTMDNFRQVESQIAQQRTQMLMQVAQNRDKAFQDSVGRVQDANIQQQLMGSKAYYDKLSFNDQAGLQLALKAGDVDTAMQTLRMQQSFVGNQADLDRRWRTGERLGEQDFNSLMQNTEWKNRFISQKNEFNQQTGMQLSDQEFQTKRQDAMNAWNHGERIDQQQFQLLSTDREWGYRNAAQTAQFNHDTGMQLSQFEFAKTQQAAQNKFNHDERLGDQDWKAMMADKDFAHQTDIISQQFGNQLGIMDHQGYMQTLMTQGPKAALGFQIKDLQAQGKPVPPDIQAAYDNAQGDGFQSGWGREDALSKISFQRDLSAGLLQAYASTANGARYLDNLFNNKDFTNKLMSGSFGDGELEGYLSGAGDANAKEDAGYAQWLASRPHSPGYDNSKDAYHQWLKDHPGGK